ECLGGGAGRGVEFAELADVLEQVDFAGAAVVVFAADDGGGAGAVVEGELVGEHAFFPGDEVQRGDLVQQVGDGDDPLEGRHGAVEGHPRRADAGDFAGPVGAEAQQLGLVDRAPGDAAVHVAPVGGVAPGVVVG